MKGIKGKNVLITGATSGIGEAIALRFAKEGANIAINYRKDLEKAEKTQEKIDRMCSQVQGCGGKELPVQADVSREEEVIEMCARVIDKLGSFDILINNAGIQIPEASHEVKTENFDKVLDVNLRGAYFCAREAIKHFLDRKSEGIIINVSSVHEIIPRPEYLSYSISKGGMGSMTKTLALEYARRQIRVNAIAPGATITSINDDWLDDPEKRQEMEEAIPMGRIGNPEEMAAAAVFLASDEAKYITGQTLFIDGGLTLYPHFR